MECEEKRWRGQLKRPLSGPPLSASQSSASNSESKPESKSPSSRKEREKDGAPAADLPLGPVAHLVAVAAQTAAATAPALQPAAPTVGATVDSPEVPTALRATQVQQAIAIVEPVPVDQTEVNEVTSPPAETTEVSIPDFVLSAGLELPPSWIRANIFVIVVVLLVSAGVALTILLH